jgi:DNA-binding MarR family transcriptional regulator
LTSEAQPDLMFDLQALLYYRFNLFERLLLKKIKQTEYDFLSIPQLRIFGLMRGNVITISRLAKWLDISRQAVQKTVSSLVIHGMLKLVESPSNRSAKEIEMTEKGRKLWEEIKGIRQKMESDLADKIGPERLTALKEILRQNWG